MVVKKMVFLTREASQIAYFDQKISRVRNAEKLLAVNSHPNYKLKKKKDIHCTKFPFLFCILIYLFHIYKNLLFNQRNVSFLFYLFVDSMGRVNDRRQRAEVFYLLFFAFPFFSFNLFIYFLKIIFLN